MHGLVADSAGHVVVIPQDKIAQLARLIIERVGVLDELLICRGLAYFLHTLEVDDTCDFCKMRERLGVLNELGKYILRRASDQSPRRSDTRGACTVYATLIPVGSLARSSVSWLGGHQLPAREDRSVAETSVDENAFDRAAYQEADQQFRLVNETLPRPAITSLAREVVRRLAFRMPRAVKQEELPNSSEIDLLCDALLSSDDRDADDIIVTARREGVPVETIYLGYVAGAARRLGGMWDADEISFMDVTLACAKLYRMMRALRHVVAPAIVEDRDERPAMFALVPGETHSLGIEMATDIFRRQGWDVDMLIGLDHETLIDRSDRRSYRAIVLVAHSDTMLEPLARLVLALRISHPLAHVVVAGHILDHYPDISGVVGADAVIKDIKTAVHRLQDLMDGPLS